MCLLPGVTTLIILQFGDLLVRKRLEKVRKWLENLVHTLDVKGNCRYYIVTLEKLTQTGTASMIPVVALGL
jgi:hypothetical protein